MPVYERLELFPDASSEENVFFLQLESVNAVAALGKAVVGERKYSDIYVPNLMELSREGVLFPFASGNTMQTGRSAEAVLCGVNHHPFSDKIGSRTPFFTNPQNFIEGYLNSLGEQDACLNQFWTAFSAFAGQNSHLFVFGDHSWPVGINGSTFNEEGHVSRTSFLYVPPRNRAGETRIGTRPDTMIGQTDLPSTVLDLLRIGTGSNSFAPILRGIDQSGYEECQVLVQPYGERTISVAKDRMKYTYELSSGTLTRSDLSRSLLDENPVVVEKGVS